MAIILTDSYATGYGFVHKKFAKIVCQILQIKSQRLLKLKQM